MSDEVRVKGLPELQAFLNQLPVKIERNVMRGAMRAAAGAVLPVARANIRNRSGQLAKDMKIGTRARGGTVYAILRSPTFYAKMVEFGTRSHTITAANRASLSIGGMFFQSVHHPGAKKGAYLRPALDSQAGAALVAAGEYVKARLADKHGIDTSDVMIKGDE